MQQKQLAILLLKPSVLSGTLCVLAALGLLIFANYAHILGDERLNDYLYGHYGLVVTFEQYFERFTEFVGGLSPDQTTTYNLFVLAAAIVIGAVTYVLLQGVTHFLAAVFGDYLIVSEATADKRPAAVEVVERWVIRVVSLVIWVGYGLLFVNIVLPFCMLAANMAGDSLLSPAAWASSILCWLILAIGLHGHVVFLRLLLLRPRVFGGQEEVLEAYAAK